MSHTIDSLCARIIILEKHILSLQKYTSNHTPVSKEFYKSFKSHITSYIIFRLSYKPTPHDVKLEIKTLWNQLSKEEQSHWIKSTS